MKREAVLIRTGVANTASITAALARAGAEVRASEDPKDVERADFAVLPGVGAFGAGMQALRANSLVEPLKKRIAEGRPTLCVCLGLQLLCRSSEESPGVEGLDILPVPVERFKETPGLRIPQLGWNEVKAGPGCQMLSTGYAYYANSYRITAPPIGWAAAITEYGGPFVAAIERGRVLGCQFHPELSSAWGAGLIERWLGGGKLC